MNQSKCDNSKDEDAIDTACTPNNAHPHTVPETPASSITDTNALRYKTMKTRRRRRARISSSSDESLVPLPQPATLGMTSAGSDKDLFRGLHISKRTKKEVLGMENKPSNIPRSRDNALDVNGWDNEKPAVIHRPRKLSYKHHDATTEDEMEEEFISLCRKRKPRRKCVVDLSSDSSEDLPAVRLTTSGKDKWSESHS